MYKRIFNKKTKITVDELAWKKNGETCKRIKINLSLYYLSMVVN